MARIETTRRKFSERYKITEAGCWEWQAYIDHRGYGKMMAFGQQYAHRVSYILHKGLIPEGLDIMHKCDNTICVNPDHLSVCKHAENMRDMVKKKRSAWGESHRCAKLTADCVVQLRNGEISVYEAAKKFGTALITAVHARKGITWQHLNDVAAPQ